MVININRVSELGKRCYFNLFGISVKRVNGANGVNYLPSSFLYNLFHTVYAFPMGAVNMVACSPGKTGSKGRRAGSRSPACLPDNTRLGFTISPLEGDGDGVEFIDSECDMTPTNIFSVNCRSPYARALCARARYQ